MDGFKRSRQKNHVDESNSAQITDDARATLVRAQREMLEARKLSTLEASRTLNQADDTKMTSDQATNLEPSAPKKARLSRGKKWLIALLIFIAVLAAAAVSAYWWYGEQIKAVSSDEKKQSIVINEGESTANIAEKLKTAGLIRDSYAFQLYARLNGKTDLKSGTCRLSPSQVVGEIIENISDGCHVFKVITFYPGGML